jgi:hypothetical protein
VICDLRFAPRRILSAIRTMDADETVEPKLVLSVSLSFWLPTERRRSSSRGSLRIVSGLAEYTHSIFCDRPSGPETANGCPVLRRQEPPPDYLSSTCQEKRDRRSLSVDGAHSQFSDGDSYPYCGGAAKVARKAWLAGASLSDGFRRLRMCLRARGPAKTRMLVRVDR